MKAFILDLNFLKEQNMNYHIKLLKVKVLLK